MRTRKEITHTPRELLTEMQALIGEAQAMMTNSLSEHSAEALSSLRTRFVAVRDRFLETYDEVKQRVVDGAECTDTAIRENPYRAAAIALGVGVLLGVLIGRRSE